MTALSSSYRGPLMVASTASLSRYHWMSGGGEGGGQISGVKLVCVILGLSCPSLVCVEERRGCGAMRWCRAGPQTRLETGGVESVSPPPVTTAQPGLVIQTDTAGCQAAHSDTQTQTLETRGAGGGWGGLLSTLIVRSEDQVNPRASHHLGITFLAFIHGNFSRLNTWLSVIYLIIIPFIISLQNGVFDNYQTTIIQLQ